MMELKEKQLAIHITTKCTLNCRLCATMMPYFRKRGLSAHVPYEQLCREMDCLFEIYDYIQDLTFSGGEPLMHPDIYKITKYCLKHSEKYETLRIFTNGTIIPKSDLLELIKSSKEKLAIVIDDYGPDKSKKAGEIRELMLSCGINIRTIKYYGDTQDYGGWINHGHPIEQKCYTNEQVRSIFEKCHLAHYKCPATMNGRLHNCSWSSMLVELGYIQKDVGSNEFVDMFDDTIPLQEKKTRVFNFGNQILEACQWCNGFNSSPGGSLRFPAAEQV